MNNKNTRI